MWLHVGRRRSSTRRSLRVGGVAVEVAQLARRRHVHRIGRRSKVQQLDVLLGADGVFVHGHRYRFHSDGENVPSKSNQNREWFSWAVRTIPLVIANMATSERRPSHFGIRFAWNGYVIRSIENDGIALLMWCCRFHDRFYHRAMKTWFSWTVRAIHLVIGSAPTQFDIIFCSTRKKIIGASAAPRWLPNDLQPIRQRLFSGRLGALKK